MIYIYDATLNFNTMLYNFYEWDEKDNICHYKRVPLFKVSKNLMYDLFNKEICIEQDFVNLLKNKAEIIKNDNIIKEDGTCIFSDENEVIAVKIDKNGRIRKRSRLLISEELEILELVTNIKSLILNYKAIKSIKYKTWMRNENNINHKLKKRIEKVQDQQLINFLNFEWFNTEDSDKNKLISQIEMASLEKKKEFLNMLNSISIK